VAVISCEVPVAAASSGICAAERHGARRVAESRVRRRYAQRKTNGAVRGGARKSGGTGGKSAWWQPQACKTAQQEPRKRVNARQQMARQAAVHGVAVVPREQNARRYHEAVRARVGSVW